MNPLVRKLPRALALVVIAVVAGLYGVNISRNVRGRESVTRSCAVLRAHPMASAPAARMMSRILGPDATTSPLADLDAMQAVQCRAATDRLAWWRWNYNAVLELPEDRARVERFRASMTRVSERCRPVMREVVEELVRSLGSRTRTRPPDVDAELERLCQGMDQSARRAQERPPRFPVWSWPARLEQMATLVQRARR